MTREEFVETLFMKSLITAIVGLGMLAIAAISFFTEHYYAAFSFAVFSLIVFREAKTKLNKAKVLRVLVELEK